MMLLFLGFVLFSSTVCGREGRWDEPKGLTQDVQVNCTSYAITQLVGKEISPVQCSSSSPSTLKALFLPNGFSFRNGLIEGASDVPLNRVVIYVYDSSSVASIVISSLGSMRGFKRSFGIGRRLCDSLRLHRYFRDSRHVFGFLSAPRNVSAHGVARREPSSERDSLQQ